MELHAGCADTGQLQAARHASAMPSAGPGGFWIAGFEGADHRDHRGFPLDPATVTGHLRRLGDDYAALARMGFSGVRESVGWRIGEPAPGRFDFRRVRAKMAAARGAGIRILWTVMHYGIPDDLSFEHPGLRSRFQAFCHALACEVVAAGGQGSVYTTVNEISFLSHALAETSLVYPRVPVSDSSHAPAAGYAIKRRLVELAIAGTHAVREVDPRARFMSSEPLIHVAAPADAPAGVHDHASGVADSQWQATDMLCGLRDSDLGGHPSMLDWIGLNHYHSSQWDLWTREPLGWLAPDPRRRPLSYLLSDASGRYGLPVVLSETSHFGAGRADWFEQVALEAERALAAGVPLQGVCVYPVLDRTSWTDAHCWHRSGLWDLFLHHASGRLEPHLCKPYARSILRWQRRLAPQAPRTRLNLHATRSTGRAVARTLSRSNISMTTSMTTLIVFSHLRWNFVHQRPQHLLTRLAPRWPVVFIEEPVFSDGPAGLERIDAGGGVLVLRPHTPVRAAGFHDAQVAYLQPMLSEFVAREGLGRHLVWFYTPMALPLLPGLEPEAVIYDCMDELAAFKDAPRQMAQRDSALLKRADLVFTGGPGLYEHKRSANPQVHCFPSSVDRDHFASAPPLRDPSEARPPVLGFFGVIDERLDIGMVAAVADAHPDWKLVMVGPVVKIDPAVLPRRANIEWRGQVAYADLPALIGAWDISLVPFAINESTRFISPTKTLEYMAAGRPVVSTPIQDVVTLYGDAVEIASTPDAFVRACEAVLSEPATARAARVERMERLVAASSWDRTAAAIAERIEAVLQEGSARRNHPEVAAAAPSSATSANGATPIGHALAGGDGERRARHLILGAGPTGLSAAYHLGADAVLLERESTVGGWCRSIVDGGFTFDFAGHIMFSNDPFVLGLYDTLLGDNQHWQDREAWIFSKGVHTRYPFQGALYGLPPKVLTDCLVGAIEARFGSLDGKAGAPRQPAEPPRDFEQFIHEVWGSGIAEHFALPYNRKLWAVPLSEMETSWLGGRVPLPDLRQMIEGALEPSPPPMGPNARFGYPLRGGFQALMDAFVPRLEGPLHLDARVVAVAPSLKQVRLADGRSFRYETLISTLPLPALVKACGNEAPPEVRAAAAALRHVSIRCVNFGVGRGSLTDMHWIYYPEDTVFHRIFVQGNASPYNNPPGGFGLTCEISYNESKPLPCDGDELIERAWQDCIRVGMVREDDVRLVANMVDMPCAYVVYDHARAANVALIRQWMEGHGVILAGRYSEWEYYNSDHAFLAGRKAAEQAQAWLESRPGSPRESQAGVAARAAGSSAA